MRALDLLLLVAVVLLVAAGWIVTPALGLAVGGLGCAAVWWLLGEAVTDASD